MIKQYKTLIYILLLITLVFASDDGLELIHADKTIGTNKNGEQLRIFTGNVHFQQDTVDMYCQKAVYYDDRDKAEFIGDVLINDGHRTLTADKIEYYPQSKLAVCIGRVAIKGPTDSLYAEYFTYNFDTEKTIAKKNLYILDEENNVQIWGMSGIYEPDKNHSLVKENARLAKIDTASGDTLIITAYQLEYFNSGGEKTRAIATDSVVIIQGALKAVCDTAVYFTEKEIIWLNHNPIAWYEDSELSGVKMKVLLDSLKIKNIFIYDRAKAKSLADSLKEKYNVLRGKDIEFQIEKNKPKTIIAKDNASSVYYLKDEETDQGINYATSDTIVVNFFEGELDSIKILGGAEGIFYPDNYKGEKAFEE